MKISNQMIKKEKKTLVEQKQNQMAAGQNNIVMVELFFFKI